MHFVPYSDVIILIQLQTNIGKMNLIQVYAPTASKSDEDIEKFYELLDDVLKIRKTRNITIEMGDHNAKIG